MLSELIIHGHKWEIHTHTHTHVCVCILFRNQCKTCIFTFVKSLAIMGHVIVMPICKRGNIVKQREILIVREVKREQKLWNSLVLCRLIELHGYFEEKYHDIKTAFPKFVWFSVTCRVIELSLNLLKPYWSRDAPKV